MDCGEMTKGAANIAQCLQSVNSQTYTNIEHIIVDGTLIGYRYCNGTYTQLQQVAGNKPF